MNEFLRTKQQLLSMSKLLADNSYMLHPISCKDWELAIVTMALGHGDLLDMGADGSFVLHNAIKKGMRGGLEGRKVGIDLVEVKGDNKAEGAEYFKGDLMHTPFEDKSFDTVVSLSTIEHEVDLTAFAKEVSRLLRHGGELIVSFDYWNPKVNTDDIKLYGLKWNILDINDLQILTDACRENDLELTSEVDLTLQDAVINPQYCSPSNVSYTFGILAFIKV